MLRLLRPYLVPFWQNRFLTSGIGTLLMALISISPAMAEEVKVPADLPLEYHQCHKVLWTPPATTLKDFVPKGYGARLSSGDLEDQW